MLLNFIAPWESVFLSFFKFFFFSLTAKSPNLLKNSKIITEAQENLIILVVKATINTRWQQQACCVATFCQLPIRNCRRLQLTLMRMLFYWKLNVILWLCFSVRVRLFKPLAQQSLQRRWAYNGNKQFKSNSAQLASQQSEFFLLTL